MTTTIAVAGATGNLGRRIVSALIERGASVRALVRVGTGVEKRAKLEGIGGTIAEVDMADVSGLTRAIAGTSCVVSAVQGLRDVIVDGQSALLEAAIAAGVPRMIPSDFALDFFKVPDGQNRNLDLRRAFHATLDAAPIAATSILNGAFGDIMTSRMGLFDFDARTVSYWGDADQRLDFTTTDDIAAFAAEAALDPAAPKVLRIAGDQISARGLATVAGEVTGGTFELVRKGSLDDLAGFIRGARASKPESENELFPMWQGAQYMHNMSSGLGKLDPIDNDRYPGLRWSTARDLIAAR